MSLPTTGSAFRSTERAAAWWSDIFEEGTCCTDALGGCVRACVNICAFPYASLSTVERISARCWPMSSIQR
jgi:hypothetical protein